VCRTGAVLNTSGSSVSACGNASLRKTDNTTKIGAIFS